MRNKHHIREICIAAVLALCAIIVSYITTNINLALTSEKTVLKYWTAFTDWISAGSDATPPDDVVLINIAYDKELVEIADDFDIPLGNAAITDRNKLLQLLNKIDSARTYQYVLLDVFFEDGYTTSADSSLFEKIRQMDRIVIPRHRDAVLDPQAPIEKAAYADYNTSINENDFTKYRLFSKNGLSMPLKVYSDLTGRTVKKTFLWYSDGGHLSRQVVFPKMYVRADSPYRANGQKAFLNLGTDILDYKIDWAKFFDGKFIVIGAFQGDDIHTTYAGDLSGSLINYNIFLSLMKGQHKISFGLILFYLIIFFTMGYLLLREQTGVPLWAKSFILFFVIFTIICIFIFMIQHNIPLGLILFYLIIFFTMGYLLRKLLWAWVWAKLFILYFGILTIICIFVFMIWGQAHDIFITSTFFSIVDLINRRIKRKAHA